MIATKEEYFIEAGTLEWKPAGEGVRRKILGYEDRIMMVKVEFQKGAVGAPHTHPHVQVTYVHAGELEVTVEGRKKVLRAGDCFYIPSNALHGVVALEETVLVDCFTPMRDDMVKADSAVPE